MMAEVDPTLKQKVKSHWEDETCGIRYGEDADRRAYFDQISAARYALEPYLKPFADFPSAKGKRVLEIGVGAGADFENWCREADHVTGIDLTERAIELARERLELSGIPAERYELRTADAENLTFDDGVFDLVYSWGVLHHSPDTQKAFAEAYRVLRPGGTLRAMIYHVNSWIGMMLYLQKGLARGRPFLGLRRAIYDHLESPGTKAYTPAEARAMLEQVGFSDVRASTALGPGDLLTIQPSQKYQSSLFKVVWAVYPRWLVRMLGDRFGLNLLLTARKPEEAAR